MGTSISFSADLVMADFVSRENRVRLFLAFLIIVLVNPAAERIFGADAQSFQGKNFLEALPGSQVLVGWMPRALGDDVLHCSGIEPAGQNRLRHLFFVGQMLQGLEIPGSNPAWMSS